MPINVMNKNGDTNLESNNDEMNKLIYDALSTPLYANKRFCISGKVLKVNGTTFKAQITKSRFLCRLLNTSLTPFKSIFLNVAELPVEEGQHFNLYVKSKFNSEYEFHFWIMKNGANRIFWPKTKTITRHNNEDPLYGFIRRARRNLDDLERELRKRDSK